MKKMNHEERKEFIQLHRALRDKIMGVDNKGGEYSRSNEANANFHRCAERYGVAPEIICLIYMDKHLDAIINYIQKEKPMLTETLNSRCHDICNYAEILHSLIAERRLK